MRCSGRDSGCQRRRQGARVRGREGARWSDKRLGRRGRRGPRQQPRAARKQTAQADAQTREERRGIARTRQAETLGRWRPRSAAASLRGTWHRHVTRISGRRRIALWTRAQWRPQSPLGTPPLRHDIHDMAWTLATNSPPLLALLRSRSLPRLPAQPGLIIMAGGGAAPSTCALDLDGAEPASQQPAVVALAVL
jgi:hypothetical protein